jgi:hypothetical protein
MGNIGRKLRETPIILEPFPDETPAEPAIPLTEPEPVGVPAPALEPALIRMSAFNAYVRAPTLVK